MRWPVVSLAVSSSYRLYSLWLSWLGGVEILKPFHPGGPVVGFQPRPLCQRSSAITITHPIYKHTYNYRLKLNATMKGTLIVRNHAIPGNHAIPDEVSKPWSRPTRLRLIQLHVPSYLIQCAVWHHFSSYLQYYTVNKQGCVTIYFRSISLRNETLANNNDNINDNLRNNGSLEKN